MTQDQRNTIKTAKSNYKSSKKHNKIRHIEGRNELIKAFEASKAPNWNVSFSLLKD